MTASDETVVTERARAEETVRAIVEELDRPTLALLYKTLHDALGFRIETLDIAIRRAGRRTRRRARARHAVLREDETDGRPDPAEAQHHGPAARRS